LEDVASFNLTVTREKHHSTPKRPMIGNCALRESERIGKALGHANRNHATMPLGLQDLKKL